MGFNISFGGTTFHLELSSSEIDTSLVSTKFIKNTKSCDQRDRDAVILLENFTGQLFISHPANKSENNFTTNGKKPGQFGVSDPNDSDESEKNRNATSTKTPMMNNNQEVMNQKVGIKMSQNNTDFYAVRENNVSLKNDCIEYKSCEKGHNQCIPAGEGSESKKLPSASGSETPFQTDNLTDSITCSGRLNSILSDESCNEELQLRRGSVEFFLAQSGNASAEPDEEEKASDLKKGQFDFPKRGIESDKNPSSTGSLKESMKNSLPSSFAMSDYESTLTTESCNEERRVSEIRTGFLKESLNFSDHENKAPNYNAKITSSDKPLRSIMTSESEKTFLKNNRNSITNATLKSFLNSESSNPYTPKDENDSDSSENENYRDGYASLQVNNAIKFRQKTVLHSACENLKSKVWTLHKLLNERPGDASVIDLDGNLPLHLISLNQYLLFGRWAAETRYFIDELIDIYPG